MTHKASASEKAVATGVVQKFASAFRRFASFVTAGVLLLTRVAFRRGTKSGKPPETRAEQKKRRKEMARQAIRPGRAA